MCGSSKGPDGISERNGESGEQQWPTPEEANANLNCLRVGLDDIDCIGLEY